MPLTYEQALVRVDANENRFAILREFKARKTEVEHVSLHSLVCQQPDHCDCWECKEVLAIVRADMAAGR
jgi:hypothetical protein